MLNNMKHKLIIIVLTIFAVLGTVIFLPATSPEQAKPADNTNTQATQGEVVITVHMGEESYEPSEFVIQKGQAVRFVNDGNQAHWPASNVHPTHDIYPEFDPKRELAPGEEWVFTFGKAGVWRMHDHNMPFIKGTITVEE